MHLKAIPGFEGSSPVILVLAMFDLFVDGLPQNV